MTELGPLKLDKARFRVTVETLAPEKAGPAGQDRVAFEISTNPGAPFGELGQIASGGELARLALALKAALAGRAEGAQPLMIFDEVDQGVGGAVADAVGLRLRRLAADAQVLVVTHSPQVAARGSHHWRVSKETSDKDALTRVAALDRETRIKSVLCLFEGVATGAADGYARIAGKPAMTLLHLGAGYLNGGANIHNAKRAHTPMINVIGTELPDHAPPG